MRTERYLSLVGANIQRARWLAKLTQPQAAKKAKVTLRYFQEVERGHRNATLLVLFHIAHALKISVTDLTDVPGVTRSPVPVAALEAEAPRPGRKPRQRRKALPPRPKSSVSR